ncbi:MAG: (2Fe-2S)-binding protein [Planctomycetes bacterium]|nr:(2Fe-2S)-binding protein [Planctomycetota bacterium]
MRIVELSINGTKRKVIIRDHDVLLDVIRENANLTGTKRGCDIGSCGACTVQIDGVARLSCLTLAHEAIGHEVTTIEGLKDADRLHPVQAAFEHAGGSQCGFCTPGFLMTSSALLNENPHPTRDEIKEAISSNICRCTGYVKIVKAIEEAAGV